MLPVSSLQGSERVYCQPFDFYSSHQDQECRNDLSKMVYHCKRSSKVYMVNHPALSPLVDFILAQDIDVSIVDHLVDPLLCHGQAEKTKKEIAQQANNCLKSIQLVCNQVIIDLQNDFSLHEGENDNCHLEVSFTFQHVLLRTIETFQRDIEATASHFTHIFRSVLAGISRSVIISSLAYPLLHSLIVPLHAFYTSSHIKPKIAFLNLDAKESPYSIRALNTLPQQFLYFSIYDQPESKKSGGFESAVDALECFQNVGDFYSQEMLRQSKRIHRNCYSLKSSSLRRNYLQIPILSTSAEIYALFEQAIMPKMNDFQPQMVIISFNGALPLKEDHFADICKALSVVAHHRVILHYSSNCAQPELSMNQESLEDTDEMIKRIAKFIRDYLPQRQLFPCFHFAQFIQTTSGKASLDSNFASSSFSVENTVRQYLKMRNQIIWDSPPSHIAPQQLDELFLLQSNFQLVRKSQQCIFLETTLNLVISELINDERLSNYLSLTEELSVTQHFMFGKREIMEEYMGRPLGKRYLTVRGGVSYNLSFYLKDGLQEDIYLSEAVQVITHENKIIILNYRLPGNDFTTLWGDLSVESGQRVMLQDIGSSMSSPQIVYLNYTVCIFQHKAYLFWPQEWNLRLYLRCKLIHQDYPPQHVHQMLCVDVLSVPIFSVINLENTSNVMPRMGCVAVAADTQSFFIFGGLNCQNDTNVLLVHLGIEGGKITRLAACSPQRVGSRIEVLCSQNQTFLVSKGGYGPRFTGTHGLFSRQTHIFNSDWVSVKKDVKSEQFILACHPRPILSRRPLGTLSKNCPISPKLWHLGWTGTAVVSFIQTCLTLLEIISMNSTIPASKYLLDQPMDFRSKIGLFKNHPEVVRAHSGSKEILQIRLQNQQNAKAHDLNYIVPRSQLILSLRFSQNSFFVLSNSPSILSPSKQVFLFRTNGQEVEVSRNQSFFAARKMYSFPVDCKLEGKSVFVVGRRVLVMGGHAECEGSLYRRVDYLIWSCSGEYRLGKRLILSESNLSSPHGMGLETDECLLFYSTCRENQRWVLKIEAFYSDFVRSEAYLRVNSLNIITKPQRWASINPQHFVFTAIIPYTRLNQTDYLLELHKLSSFLEGLRLHTPTLQFLISLFDREVTFSSENILLLSQSIWGMAVENVMEVPPELIKDIKKVQWMTCQYLLEMLAVSDSTQKLYAFVLQDFRDNADKLVKYLSVGPSNSTSLRFSEMRFSIPMHVCPSASSLSSLFVHPHNLINQAISIIPNQLPLNEEETKKHLIIKYSI